MLSSTVSLSVSACSLFLNSVELLSTHSRLFVPVSWNDAIKTHLSLCIKAGDVPDFMVPSQHIFVLGQLQGS